MSETVPISPEIISLLEKFPVPARIINLSGVIAYMNKEMRDTFGNLVGEKASIIFEDKPSRIDTIWTPDYAYEVVLSDVTYRVIESSITAETGEEWTLEFFEDFSVIHSLQVKLMATLAKVNKETKVAKSIQQSLLPINDEYWNIIDYHAIYLPADDLGGDFYDLIRINEDEVLMYIADVSGHGIQASLLTIFIREQVKANAAVSAAGLDELLKKVLEEFRDLEIDPTLYVTMLLCKYNRRSHELSVSNAGHNCFPVIVRNGSRVEAIPIKGMPISIISEADSFEEETVGLKAGDRVILYTDGLIEEYSPVHKKEFGQEGIRRTVEANLHLDTGKMAKVLLDESAKYIMSYAKDDRTIIVAEILS
ncbi:MAG: serine/threonine-protein phosphatase [Clostridiales Family XIII bacterium]|jgi:sigma-B regulation protein RsbU (phosphoserine phosphatase)|nr:serine/threonine-protein phosphatase [Clostridiales Family XIII bacterium]